VPPHSQQRHTAIFLGKRVVAFGLAFDALPLPGGAGGARDQGPKAKLFAQVVDPAGLRTRFEADLGDALAIQCVAQFMSR
jgi:hypothetical protein